MKPLAHAQRDVLAAVPPLPEANVPLAEALGLVTATAVQAEHDVPPFTNSAMDGYAVRAADTTAATSSSRCSRTCRRAVSPPSGSGREPRSRS